MTLSPQVEFSRPLDVSAIGLHGLERSIAANEVECQALARRFALLGLERLVADLKLRWLDGKMVRLEGRLSAKVIQACVVTLDPVMAEIDAGFTRMFSEAPPMVAPEVTLDLEQDGPDPIEKGQIDLGEIVAEELALSLDPYPRGPDVVFPMARLGNGPKDGGTGA